MAFEFSYTGKDSAVKLPDMDKLLSAQEKMGEQAIRGEEAKLSKALADEKYYLDMMNTDPIAAISDANRVRQAVAIEGFNSKWGARMAKNQGDLSVTDKLELQRDKTTLSSLQNSLKADEQRFLQDEEIMQKDTRGYYDKEAFRASRQQFLQEGKYPMSALRVNPKDPEMFFRVNLPKNVSPQTTKTTSVVDGRTVVSEEVQNMTPEEAQEWVRVSIANDEALLQGVINKFEALSPAQQAKILDIDNSGSVSPEERQMVQSPMGIDNPIFNWAVETYAPVAQSKKVKDESKPATTSTASSGFKPSVPVSETNNKNKRYSLTGEKMQGVVRFNNNITMGGDITGVINRGEYIDPKDGQKKSLGSGTTWTYKILDYDPSLDYVSVSAKSNFGQERNMILTGEQVDNNMRKAGVHRQAFDGFKEGASTSAPKATDVSSIFNQK